MIPPSKRDWLSETKGRNEVSMIISKAYAKRLIKAGKARAVKGDTCTDNGRQYQIVTRLDVQRVDHYEID
jgi:hypothetical protein